MLRDLVLRNRSYRRFDQNHHISLAILKELIELARFSASEQNLQPLKFFLSCDPETNDAIFPNLVWAGYLQDWSGPIVGERPSAYIIILGDTEIRERFGCDYGIAAQSIMLGATEKGLGGCMISSVKRGAISASLNIPKRYRILLVLALGKPIEKVVIEDVRQNGDIRYYRDQSQIHHVPKRKVDEIIIG